MSHENVELVRQLIVRFNEGDWEGWMALLAPDVVYYDNPQNAIDAPAVLRGRESLREQAVSFLEEFVKWRLVSDDLIDAGDDRVVSVYRGIGTERASGAAVEFGEANVWKVRNGQLVEGRVYDDRSRALAAVGLSE